MTTAKSKAVETTNQGAVVSAEDARRQTDELVRLAASGQLSIDQLGELAGGKLLSVGEALGILGIDKDKDNYVGQHIVVMGWNFIPGDYGPDSEYATLVVAKVESNGKLAAPVGLTDGSSGLYRQLRDYEDTRVKMGAPKVFECKNGFTRSDYRYCEDDRHAADDTCADEGHVTIPAVTYYFAG